MKRWFLLVNNHKFYKCLYFFMCMSLYLGYLNFRLPIIIASSPAIQEKKKEWKYCEYDKSYLKIDCHLFLLIDNCNKRSSLLTFCVPSTTVASYVGDLTEPIALTDGGNYYIPFSKWENYSPGPILVNLLSALFLCMFTVICHPPTTVSPDMQ